MTDAPSYHRGGIVGIRGHRPVEVRDEIDPELRLGSDSEIMTCTYSAKPKRHRLVRVARMAETCRAASGKETR